MKSGYLFFIVISFLCSIQNLHSQQSDSQGDFRIHTVEIGETVYSIATLYKVPLEDIYLLNPEARQGVRANQELRIPAVKKISDKSGYLLHSIQAKETLYSVSKKYNISIEDILTANPGLNSDNFKIGNAVKIPKAGSPSSSTTNVAPVTSVASAPKQTVSDSDDFIFHTIQPKETLYSLSKQYNLTIQEMTDVNPTLKSNGVKVGMLIRIPRKIDYPTSIVYEVNSGDEDYYPITQQPSAPKGSVIRIGVLLPFYNQPETMQARIVEYYEGFLLALEEMKAKGYSAEIYTFDIRKGAGTDKIKSLLETSDMKNLDLIVGGMSDEEISLISQFAQQENIEYAIPFPVKNSHLVKGDRTFQLNTSQSDLFSNIIDRFCREFSDYNVIIASSDSTDEDKKVFTSALKKTLDLKGITNQTLDISKFGAEIKNSLSSSKKNIIVPSSSSLTSLRKILPVLRTINTTSSDMSISLFGYPDWQTYSSQLLQDFFKYDTYIYTTFYADNNDAKVQQFGEKYRLWYGRALMNTYPKYGLLGYDTGLYIMSTFTQNNTLFRNDSFKSTLQSTFNFEKVQGQNGYINTGFYFVHYGTDMTIKKIDFSK